MEGVNMSDNEERPYRREPMQGAKFNTRWRYKDSKYLYTEKHKSRKPTISANDHLDKKVYNVLLKKSCTTNMICEILGNKYSYQQVRHSILRLNERRLIYYWGLDICETTGGRAYYLEVRNSRQKYLPNKRNSNGR